MKYIASALALLALTIPASAQIVPPPATGNLQSNSLTTRSTITSLQPGGNGVTIAPSASGGIPSISAVGANSNVSLNIAAKGSAAINLQSSTALTGNLTATGNVFVAGQLGSAANINAPSPTNSGITIGGSPTWAMASFYDQSVSANNRSADMLLISNSLKFRFANDARTAFTDFLSINGGQGSGVTGITSTSGTGAWVHTGDFQATGNLTSGGIMKASGGNQLQTFLTAAIPNCSGGNTGLMVAVLDASSTPSAPAWNAVINAGTGTPSAAATFPIFCDGTNWRYH
jgi:hypothetical protein